MLGMCEFGRECVGKEEMTTFDSERCYTLVDGVQGVFNLYKLSARACQHMI